jgi:hypothetical protein
MRNMVPYTKETTQRVSENRVRVRTYGSKEEEVKEGWR